MAKYLLDENNNKIEVTDEVGNTTVEEIKCCVSNTPYKIAFVTQAKYNELEATGLLQTNTIYEITDDQTADDLEAQLVENKTTLEAHQTTLEAHQTTLNEHLNRLVALETIDEVTQITKSGLYSVDIVVAGTNDVVHTAIMYITYGTASCQIVPLYYYEPITGVIYYYTDGHLSLETHPSLSGYYAIGKIRSIL